MSNEPVVELATTFCNDVFSSKSFSTASMTVGFPLKIGISKRMRPAMLDNILIVDDNFGTEF